MLAYGANEAALTVWQRRCEQWLVSEAGHAICIRAWKHLGDCHYLTASEYFKLVGIKPIGSDHATPEA